MTRALWIIDYVAALTVLVLALIMRQWLIVAIMAANFAVITGALILEQREQQK